MEEYIKLFKNKEELESGIANLPKPSIATSKDTEKVVFKSLRTKSSGVYKTSTTTEGESVLVKNVTTEPEARIIATATNGNVVLKNAVVNGAYTKAKGNTVISVNASDDVTIDGVDMTNADLSWNAIEVGLNSTPSNVDIENVTLKSAKNNGILLFKTEDNAIINIKNVDFGEQVSNAIRISNYSNAKNVTINIENCKVGRWDDGREGAPSYPSTLYAGFFIFEDYCQDHNTVEKAKEANLFGPDKIKIHIKNLTVGGKPYKPEDVTELLGTGDIGGNRFGFISYDSANYAQPEYDENLFPEIAFK